MLNLAKKYVRQYGSVTDEDAIIAGINVMYGDLTRDDAETFKRGYSHENAMLVLTEQFNLTPQQIQGALNGEGI
jgi:hypothetical protein